MSSTRGKKKKVSKAKSVGKAGELTLSKQKL